MAGDQQAALFGQACFEPGMVKSTYGTGAFLLLNTGRDAVNSTKGLITTPACRLDGRMTYALEGSIFVAGAAVKWLRDALLIIADASDTERLAGELPDNRGVYLVPAFVGLGAPYWEPDVRAVITGLTLDVTRAHLARAALEAVAYQTRDLVNAMTADGCQQPTALRIDGGMAANDWLCQFLAGLATDVWSDLPALSRTWKARSHFNPAMEKEERRPLLAGWRRAIHQAMAAA
jgi:glycerol kinase